MKTTRWTQPRLTVVSRTLDENVLAFCKGWEGGAQSENAEFSDCARASDVSYACWGCTDYQVS